MPRDHAMAVGSMTVVEIEDHGDEASVLVCRGGPGGLRLSLMTPIFDRLGVEILSFGVDKGAPQHTVTRYVVTDGTGHSLETPVVIQLVEALERDLHAQVVSTPARHHLQLQASRSNSASLEASATAPSTLSALTEAQPCPSHGDVSSCEGDEPGPQRTRQSKSVTWAPRMPTSSECSSSNIEVSPWDVGSHGAPSSPGSGVVDTAQAPPAQGTPANAVLGDQDGAGADIRDASLSADMHPSTSNDEQEGHSTWWGCISPLDPVSLIMSSPVRWISQDETLGEAKARMTEWGISSLMVDTGTPHPGFLTMRGFLNASFTKSLRKTKVQEVMSQPVIYVNVDTGIEDCLRVMQTSVQQVRRVAIYDPAKFDPDQPGTWRSCWVGMVSDTDVFRCIGQPKNVEGGCGCEPPQAGRTASGQSGWSAASSLGASAGSHNSSISIASAVRIASHAASISTEDRYRAAAALWELDFSELEIIRKIGEGSFGEVVLASFRGTKVAVKRLRGFDSADESGPSPTMQPVLSEFFEREIGILASIRHPNIVTFIGACHTPPNVALITEFCARGSLDQLLHKSSLHLDLSKRVEMAMDVARGMTALHGSRPPIVHRDMKTANLLVSARLEVKVADFGLSRIKNHAQLVNSRAGLEGTIEYCAPEVLRGEPFTEKCDVYSFGVVCWELFNRQRPFADADVPIFLLMISLGNGQLKLPALSEAVSSPGLVKLWERCMAWDPQDRPSFREVLHSLENEYKVVRGKAAAVPRSDSVWCMSSREGLVPPLLQATNSQQNMVDVPPADDAAGTSQGTGAGVVGERIMRPDLQILAKQKTQPRAAMQSRFAPAAGAAPPEAPVAVAWGNSKSGRRSNRRMQRSTSTPASEPAWLGADEDDEQPVAARPSLRHEAGAVPSIGHVGVVGAQGLDIASTDAHTAVAAPQQPASVVVSESVMVVSAPSKSPFAMVSPFGAYPAFDEAPAEEEEAAAELESVPSRQQEDVDSLPASISLRGSSRELPLGIRGVEFEEAAVPGDSQTSPVPRVQQWVSPFAGAATAFSDEAPTIHTQDDAEASVEMATINLGASQSMGVPPSPAMIANPPVPPHLQVPGKMLPQISMQAPAAFGNVGMMILSPKTITEANAAPYEASPCPSPRAESTMHTTAWVVI